MPHQPPQSHANKAESDVIAFHMSGGTSTSRSHAARLPVRTDLGARSNARCRSYGAAAAEESGEDSDQPGKAKEKDKVPESKAESEKPDSIQTDSIKKGWVILKSPSGAATESSMLTS